MDPMPANIRPTLNVRLPTGVYIPTAQYDEECEERKFLNGRWDLRARAM